jgi:gephyrin
VQDGYAVVAADGVGEFPVVGEARCGAIDPQLAVLPGTVAYITTGAPLPPGADAVVQVRLAGAAHAMAHGCPAMHAAMAVQR